MSAEGLLAGRPVICCSMEFGFIGGSMGAVVGEKVTRAVERMRRSQNAAGDRFLFRRRAHDGGHDQPDAVGQSFRGAGALDEVRVPFISVLTDPTTGGVTASYAMLGDLNIAEPGALIGFAGTARDRTDHPPETAGGIPDAPNFLLEHGFLDAVVHSQGAEELHLLRSRFFLG